MSLRTRLLLVFLVLTVGTSALFGTLVYRGARDGLVAAALRTVGTIASDRRRQLLGTVRNERRRLEVLASERGGCSGIGYDRVACARHLSVVAAGELAHSAVVWRDGIVVAEAGADSAALRSDPLGAGRSAQLRGAPRPELVIAGKSADGRTLVEIALGGQRLADLFAAENDLGASGETFIADALGRPATPLRYGVTMRDHAHDNRHDNRHDNGGIAALPMRNCLTKGDGEMLAPDYHDAPIIHGYRRVPEVGGCIMAHISQPEALVQVALLRRRALVIGVLLSLGAIPLSVALASSMSRPLARLGAAVDAVGAGDYSRALSTSGPPEVRALSRAFAAMADSVQMRTAALERSNSDLDQFAYVASHDLKAPLRGIANLATWLEEDLGDAVGAESREHMALLKGRVHRMEALINGILQYARAGQSRGDLQRFPVRALIEEAIELLTIPSSVQMTVDDDLPTISTERAPLLQVFLNLIGNAVKHASGSRADARVVIRSQQEGAFYRFFVSDNGPGIAPEYHEKVWQIFSTLQARDALESTGIGLSVVRKLVEVRGGAVGLQSAHGAGATFSFSWPAHQAEMEIIPVATAGSASSPRGQKIVDTANG